MAPMILCQDRSQKAGEQGKQSLHISTALRDSTVSEVVLWGPNAKEGQDSSDNRTYSWEKPQKVIYFCCNRWLTGVMQPTFPPQERRAAGTTNPVLLMNLHSRSAQSCGIPLTPRKTGMASQGLRIHKPHAHRLAPNQALLLVPQLSIDTVLSFHQIFYLWTKEQSQVLRHNVNLLQAQSLQM